MEQEDLHSIYVTMLELAGERAVKHNYADCYTAFMEKSKNIDYINIYKDSFNVFFSQSSFNNFFMIRIVNKLKGMGLKSRIIITGNKDFQAYKFKGELNLLLQGLIHLEKEIKKG